MKDSAQPGLPSGHESPWSRPPAKPAVARPVSPSGDDANGSSNGTDETPALRRRRQRIALIEEFGGHTADLKVVAVEAMKRGMYSPRTNRGDVELSLLRTWKLRKRVYGR